MSKDYLIKIFILITWIIFYYLNWITYSRLVFFIIIILLIITYKLLITYFERNILFKNMHLSTLNCIILLNKWRNPLLILLLNLDIKIYDIIILYNNKVINSIIYVLYVLILNPLKILYFKFYLLLRIWKNNNIFNILFSRMFGLILSILIFSNIIGYMKTELHLTIWMIIYIYLLIISVSSESIEARDVKWLKLLLVNHINTYSIIRNRLNVNILSIFIKKNSDIEELGYYINNDIKNKIDKIQIGYTWYLINSLKNFNNKPTNEFYLDLNAIINDYLITRMGSYIWFDYYKWDIPNLSCVDLDIIKNEKELTVFHSLFEYDYIVFKTLLFLYWDLEYYLEDIDYVKSSLKMKLDDPSFIRIELYHQSKSDIVFVDKIKYKKGNDFWVNNKLLNTIIDYDLYSKLYYFEIREKYLDDPVIKQYKRFNDIIVQSDINTLKEIKALDELISVDYFNGFIKSWYNEWYSEINVDLSVKYRMKINKLESEYQRLLIIFKHFDDN